jgi:hypothetical protein
MDLKTTIESLVAEAFTAAKKNGTQYGVSFSDGNICGYVSSYDTNPHGNHEISNLAVVWVADDSINHKRWLGHFDHWLYMESVNAEYANSDDQSHFAKLADQASEAERLAAVDAETLPGRLGRKAAAKANLFKEEVRYWRSLDRKTMAWASNHALVGRGNLAREVAKFTESKNGTSMFDFDATKPSWRICYDPSK